MFRASAAYYTTELMLQQNSFCKGRILTSFFAPGTRGKAGGEGLPTSFLTDRFGQKAGPEVSLPATRSIQYTGCFGGPKK